MITWLSDPHLLPWSMLNVIVDNHIGDIYWSVNNIHLIFLLIVIISELLWLQSFLNSVELFFSYRYQSVWSVRITYCNLAFLLFFVFNLFCKVCWEVLSIIHVGTSRCFKMFSHILVKFARINSFHTIIDNLFVSIFRLCRHLSDSNVFDFYWIWILLDNWSFCCLSKRRFVRSWRIAFDSIGYWAKFFLVKNFLSLLLRSHQWPLGPHNILLCWRPCCITHICFSIWKIKSTNLLWNFWLSCSAHHSNFKSRNVNFSDWILPSKRTSFPLCWPVLNFILLPWTCII